MYTSTYDADGNLMKVSTTNEKGEEIYLDEYTYEGNKTTILRYAGNVYVEKIVDEFVEAEDKQYRRIYDSDDDLVMTEVEYNVDTVDGYKAYHLSESADGNEKNEYIITYIAVEAPIGVQIQYWD